MPRRLSPIVLAAALVALASPVAAAPGAPSGGARGMTADHLGGTFTACGRIVEFTAPTVGTDGSLAVSGIVDTEDHSFVIDEEATVDPLVAALAASGEWTCLSLVGDGMGILTDVAVGDAQVCAPLATEAGTFVLVPGSTDEFTATVLDGGAGALIAAEPALEEPLTSIAATPAAGEVCLEFGLAADGSLAAILLDYAMAPVACGMVDGAPIPYRDPASQPFPEGAEVGVAGFSIDASLLEAPFLEIMSFHLDSHMELCLLAAIESNATVSAALLFDDTAVCGELEVVGGLVNVETVVVSQGLTGISFAEPSPASIEQACWSVLTPPGALGGALTVCGDFEGADAGARTFTVSGVTFHLETAIDTTALTPGQHEAGVDLEGPDPFEPFGVGNPVHLSPNLVCADRVGSTPAPLPDTAVDEPGPRPPTAPALVLAAVGVATVMVRAVGRVRRR